MFESILFIDEIESAFLHAVHSFAFIEFPFL